MGSAQRTANGAALAVTPRQQDRRARMLDAAASLLVDRSYDEIQIRDVAARSGVALGTLYRYFPSKEQLFAHVLLQWSASFDERVRAARPGRSDEENLRLALRRVARSFERYPHHFQLITVLEVSTDPAVVEPFQTYSRRFVAGLESTVPNVPEVDRAPLVELATALIGSLLRGWWLGQISTRSVHSRLDDAVRLLFAGTQPSRAMLVKSVQ